MVGGQHLIVGGQRQGTCHDVQPGGGVGDVDQVVRLCADKDPQRCARLTHQVLEAPTQELNRLALEFQLPGLVGLKDGAGTRAERSVIEKNHTGAQKKEITHSNVSAH